MNYPKVGEFVYCEELGTEIGAVPDVHGNCRVGRVGEHHCVFSMVVQPDQSESHPLCRQGSGCESRDGHGTGVIYLARIDWAVARLTR